METLVYLRTGVILVVFSTLFISFIISGLIINAIQLVLWLTVKQVSPWLYRKVNYYLLTILWNQVLLILDWSRSAINVYTDSKTWDKLGKENALLILNHSNELDWLVAWALCSQFNILGGSKLFIKKAVEWIPIIGWAWKFAEIGFLERNWERDQQTMDCFVRNLKQYPDPVVLLFFPEGTRFTSEKHAVSMEFAKKAGLPYLNNLLIPRTKGFFAITQQLRGNFDAVYSGTLCFNTKLGNKPSLLNLFLANSVFGELYLERISFDKIPQDGKESADWLLENFQERDKLMNSYNETGAFDTSIKTKNIDKDAKNPVRCHYRTRSFVPLVTYLIWAYFTLPLLFSTMQMVFGTGAMSLIGNAAIIFLTAAFIYKLIEITLISRGSSYGAKSQ